MKFTLSWLKDHLDTEADLALLTDTLTMIGFELEAVEDRAAGLEALTVARVVEAAPHPDADKLKVCRVDTGSGVVTVVCGAPNARTGMKAVFAPPGTTIPATGIVLRTATIRGVESSGMLLSEREMRLSDAHEGIIELAADTAVGARAVDVLGLADPLIDVGVTPNRGDCLGVRGLARELAATGLGTLKPLDVRPLPGAFASPIGVRLDLDGAADACPWFVGRTIRGVRNGDSPPWLQRRLLAVGLRPISALVDITNYMTLDLCRPLHVFDADRVRGDLHVRLARSSERLAALNGREYALDEEMTVIADDREAEALGGVIGGASTGCTADTVTVFVESALFDPLRTAATGRKLNVASDARYRFERGIDPSFLVDGLQIATRLILDACGGEPSDLVIAGAEPAWQRRVPLRPGRVRALGGVEVDVPEMQRILTALGFAVDDGEPWQVAVPPWRNDVVSESCLVEEIVRINGYDKIAAAPIDCPTALPTEALTAEQRRRATARRMLAGRGLVEAVTFSFMAAADAEAFTAVPDALRLINPISADLDTMRPSLLPNLIAACRRNAARGFADAALFEVGPQYAGDRPEDQRMIAAGVRSGRTGPRHWAAAARPVDVFDVKADVIAVLTALGAPVTALRVTADGPAWYHPGRIGSVRLGPNTVLATFGEIHPRIARRVDVTGPLAAFEVHLDALPPLKTRTGSRPALTLSPFQPIERDFAFVVDADTPADALMRAARAADPKLITEVRVFDVFAGGAIGAGKKSLALSIVVQPTERTLTDADLEILAAAVVASVAKATGGILRA